MLCVKGKKKVFELEIYLENIQIFLVIFGFVMVVVMIVVGVVMFGGLLFQVGQCWGSVMDGVLCLVGLFVDMIEVIGLEYVLVVV